MTGRYTPTADERLAARLDWRLGVMVRRTEQSWHELTLQKRRAYVEAFILLRDCLARVSGRRSPQLTSPWTADEIDRSMSGPLPSCWSFTRALTVESSPLVIAVGVTERELRRTGLPPQTLNSKHRRAEGLARIDHAYTVEEVLQRRRGYAPWSPVVPKMSEAEEERAWRAAAEAKIRPR